MERLALGEAKPTAGAILESLERSHSDRIGFSSEYRLIRDPDLISRSSHECGLYTYPYLAVDEWICDVRLRQRCDRGRANIPQLVTASAKVKDQQGCWTWVEEIVDRRVGARS